MSIPLNLEQVPSGYNLSKINSNFNKIQVALIEALSTSGDTPNAMNADLDMNSNDIINGGVANFQDLFVNGQHITSGGGGGGSGTLTGVAVATANGFSGVSDGSPTTPTITLSTSVSGVLKGSAGSIVAATAGTDYYAPGGTDVAVVDGGTGVSTLTGLVKGNGTSAFTAATLGTDYTGGTSGLGTGILKNTTGTGNHTIAAAGTDYQAPITLTTSGTSGAATFGSNTLNIPQYSAGGGGDFFVFVI